MARIVVVLPAPFGPEQRDRAVLGHDERDPAQRERDAVDDLDVVDGEEGSRRCRAAGRGAGAGAHAHVVYGHRTNERLMRAQIPARPVGWNTITTRIRKPKMAQGQLGLPLRDPVLDPGRDLARHLGAGLEDIGGRAARRSAPSTVPTSDPSPPITMIAMKPIANSSVNVSWPGRAEVPAVDRAGGGDQEGRDGERHDPRLRDVDPGHRGGDLVVANGDERAALPAAEQVLREQERDDREDEQEVVPADVGVELEAEERGRTVEVDAAEAEPLDLVAGRTGSTSRSGSRASARSR